MSPKERLQRKHIGYLVGSVFATTVLLTLLVLNASYSAMEQDRTNKQLQSLAKRIKDNFAAELRLAVRFLDRATPDPFITVRKDVFGLRQVTAVFDPDTRPQLKDESYAYFHYLFWVDWEGQQQVKLTVSDRATPQTDVREDAFFNDVVNDKLATLRGTSIVPEPRLRLEPVYDRTPTNSLRRSRCRLEQVRMAPWRV